MKLSTENTSVCTPNTSVYMPSNVDNMLDENNKTVQFVNEEDRRRTIRIRRSRLLDAKLIHLNKPAIKVAENIDEYSKSFNILYQEYRKVGYTPDHPKEMLYNKWSLLPNTSIFIFKSYNDVISSVSLIKDIEPFGLPLDEVAKKNVDILRNQNRRVAEAGALATTSTRRWSNLMIWLFRAIYYYSTMADFDDVVLVINPKHVRFYTQIMLFEPFGETAHYEKVGAPAVPMRVDLRTYADKLKKAYPAELFPGGQEDFETNLHTFFTKFSDPTLKAVATSKEIKPEATGFRGMLQRQNIKDFLNIRPEVKASMTPEEWVYLRDYYKL